MLYFLEINFNRILFILSLSIPLVTKQKKKKKKKNQYYKTKVLPKDVMKVRITNSLSVTFFSRSK